MPNRPLTEFLSDQRVLAAPPDQSVLDAVRQMAERNVGAILVLSDGALKGVFTERDLLRRVVAAGKDPAATQLAAVMTTEVVSIAATHRGYEAFQLMHDSGVRHVVVTGLPGAIGYGVVSIRDFAPGDLARFEKELAFEEHVWEVV